MQDKRIHEVKDYEIFLEKTEYGTNHVYQIHRELGGAFIDASFQDKEEESLMYRCRIEMPEPRQITSVIKWDENSFPYEYETYEVGGEQVQVPFYRPFGHTLNIFLDEVVDSEEFGSLPTSINQSFERIIESIQFFVDARNKSWDEHAPTRLEEEAINIAFNEGDLFSEPDVEYALAQFLYNRANQMQEIYSTSIGESDAERRETFQELENKLINKCLDELKNRGFKEGYISS